MWKPLTLGSVLLLSAACAPSTPAVDVSGSDSSSKLEAVLAGLPDEAQARFKYRNPKETLEFFGIKPGMTVVDMTPGKVWYSGILAEYLGPDGRVIGADRPLSVWRSFGPEYSPSEFLADRPNWAKTWPEERAADFGETAAQFDAFAFGAVPKEFAGSADAVMVMREFHNIMSADPSDGLAAIVLGEIQMLLKPQGVLCIVQHRAQEDADDAWANGENGYVKQSRIIALVESAGFMLEASSEINANPADQPGADDFVWRLPPDLQGSEDNAERRAQMQAIGESDRMTLRFRKGS